LESFLDTVFAARTTFAMALMFHIVFAALGAVMPFMLLGSQWLYLRRGNPVYEAINKKWTTAFALTYATGAVSGTVLTFGFGLFWPTFMNVGGPLMGYPLAIEVLFFLLEAIFLGIYVFGRDQLSPWLHFASGIPIAIGGFISMNVVILGNAWMNTPVGYRLGEAGRVVQADVLRAMFSPAWWYETTHMSIAAFEAVAFAFAAVYAFALLKDKRDEYHKRAFFVAMAVATLAAPIMIVSGDHTAKAVALQEPAKMAAMEPTFHTEKGAPVTIYGWPDVEEGKLRYAIAVPKLFSVLAYDNPDAVAPGWESFPADARPDPRRIWWAFDTMVGIGFYLALLIPWFWFAYWRARGVPGGDPAGKWLLRAIVLAGPLGFLAIELGWITTEEGRQPWAIKYVMRTSEGATTAPGLVFALFGFAVMYVLVGTIYVRLLRGMATGPPEESEAEQGGAVGA
jgi:cytochrome d ubiquinol oxidase subunit I